MELPKGSEGWQCHMKYPAAEDHNMFVCCMFLELGWSCLELELVLWTLPEPSVLEFLFKCLSVLVRSCGLVCRVVLVCLSFLFCALLLWSSWTTCSRSRVWSLMQEKPNTAALEGLAKAIQPDATMLTSTWTRHTVQCLDKGSATLSYQLLGLITKGLEDNTTKELLEPWSSEAKIPSWKAFEKQFWNVVSVWIVVEWS